MRVRDLINMLEDFAKKHGDDAYIGVPRSSYQRDQALKLGYDDDPQYGEEIFIYVSNVDTHLDSKGKEVYP